MCLLQWCAALHHNAIVILATKPTCKPLKIAPELMIIRNAVPNVPKHWPEIYETSFCVCNVHCACPGLIYFWSTDHKEKQNRYSNPPKSVDFMAKANIFVSFCLLLSFFGASFQSDLPRWQYERTLYDNHMLVQIQCEFINVATS